MIVDADVRDVRDIVVITMAGHTLAAGAHSGPVPLSHKEMVLSSELMKDDNINYASTEQDIQPRRIHPIHRIPPDVRKHVGIPAVKPDRIL